MDLLSSDDFQLGLCGRNNSDWIDVFAHFLASV
jgi:hypothetical protein